MDKRRMTEIMMEFAKVCCDDLGIPVPPIELKEYDTTNPYERGKYEVQWEFNLYDELEGLSGEKILVRPTMIGTEMQLRGTVAHECRHAWQARQVKTLADTSLYENGYEEDADEWAKQKVDATYKGAFHDVKVDRDAVWVKMGDEWYVAEGATEQLQEIVHT